MYYGFFNIYVVLRRWVFLKEMFCSVSILLPSVKMEISPSTVLICCNLICIDGKLAE